MAYECRGCGTEEKNSDMYAKQFWKDCDVCGVETCWDKINKGKHYFCKGCDQPQGHLKESAEEVTGTCSECGIETFIRRH